MRKPQVVKVTLFATSAVVALAALSTPSQAHPPNRNPAPAEAGCYNVLGDPGQSTASLVRNYKHVGESKTYDTPLHEPDVQNTMPAEGHPHHVTVEVLVRKQTTKADVKSFLLTQALAEEDCSDVRYRLRVFGEADRFITELVVPGRIGPTVELQTTIDKALLETASNSDGTTTQYAYFSITAENADGQVGDTAPDAAAGLYVSLADGGATAYGG